MEDFVTWVDTSELKRTIMRYNDEVRRLLLFYAHCVDVCRQLDDFDLL
jgi:hypothetical protein